MREPPYRRPSPDRTGAPAFDPITTHDADGLTVVRTDRADHGKRRADGAYDYFYAFATYEARVGGRELRARRYADEWRRVSIFPGEDDARWAEVPYADAAFCAVARYFFALDDVAEIIVFTSGYGTVDRTLLRR